MKRLLLLATLCFAGTHAAAFDASVDLEFAAVPHFDLRWMNASDGAMYSSSDKDNAVFVVEAYFYRCPYCHKNAPKINQLADEFRDDERVQVLDVGRDCREGDYDRWIAETRPNHPVLEDCYGSKLIGNLGVSGFPTTFVLDCNLNVVYKHRGAMQSSMSYSELKRAVNRQLAQECTQN